MLRTELFPEFNFTKKIINNISRKEINNQLMLCVGWVLKRRETQTHRQRGEDKIINMKFIRNYFLTIFISHDIAARHLVSKHTSAIVCGDGGLSQ